MKLRNKKTGEIEIVCPIYLQSQGEYNSLAELNEEWEDYEEPKEYWYIESDGLIMQNHKPTYINHLLDGLKSIGNYFETKEEAEKAVEKLKAWKRLKDKGFELKGWKFTPDMKNIKGNFVKIEAEIPYIVKNMADLDLLFGGEE